MRTTFLVVFVLLVYLPIHAQSDSIATIVQLPEEIPEDGLYWYEEIQVFKDSLGTATFEEVSANPDWFVPNNTKGDYMNHNYGYNLDAVYWAKINLRGHPEKTESFLLIIAELAIGHTRSWNYVDVWLERTNGQIEYEKTGYSIPKENKVIPSSHNTVRFELNQGEEVIFYTRLEEVTEHNPNYIQFGLIKESFWINQTYDSWLNGLYLGAIGIQFFYFLILFLIEKESIHAYFSLILLSFLVISSMFLGDSGLQEIFYPWTNQNNMLELSLIFNCLLLYGFIKYTISYFNYSKSFIIKKILPFYFGLLLLQIIFFLLYMFGAISKIPQPIRLSFIISILIGIPLCFIIALTSGKENRIQRRNFILSIFPPFLLIFLLIVDLFFGLPIEDFADTHFSSFFGISLMLSLVLLAVSTGHRTNLLKAEKEKALQKNLSDQKQINLAISRFVPNEFLLALGKSNIKEVKLGDSIAKEVTVFFSDIRDYTSLSEQMTPEENFQFVNAYNVQMGPIIQQDKGFVNQYLGDGIMAIFPESPTDALRAAIKMQQVLQSYNQQRVQEGRKAIRVGMGMHTGSLIMGITGDENRLDAATISDSVNSAARIESLTKHYGVSILLSEASIAKLTNPTEFHFRYLGEVQVKGKKQALKIYECFDGDLPEIVNLKLTTLSLFEEGIQHYFNQSFTQAALAFKSVLKQNPVDSPAKLFLNKAGRLITNGVDDDWTGVEMMADK